jgi:septal ring factor EnvC (AmiA/AmiB activator)
MLRFVCVTLALVAGFCVGSLLLNRHDGPPDPKAHQSDIKPLEERITVQEQRIKDLEQRVKHLESSERPEWNRQIVPGVPPPGVPTAKEQ